MNLCKAFRASIVPACVFQSVAIAGGYGTGREVIEFFTQYGAIGGVCGLLVAALVLSIITGLTYEFARVNEAYEYRKFFKSLIGRYWIGFELLYIGFFLLVLAVIGSAAGAILHDQFSLPESSGLILMLGGISVLIFYGRSLVEKTLVFWAVMLCGVFIFYFITSISSSMEEIKMHFTGDKMESGWLMPALRYSMALAPAAVVVLFATRGLTTRVEAFTAGAMSSLLFILPGLMLHISFTGMMPEIIEQKVPVHWIISQLDIPLLAPLYIIVLIGTFIGTGAGFIQAVNERLDAWSMERLGKRLSSITHAGVAIAGLLISAGLSKFGIIDLIAKGYGNASWGFLLFYIIPLLTIGVYRIFGRTAVKGVVRM